MADLAITADLNDQDDDVLGWSSLADAAVPRASAPERCCSPAALRLTPSSGSSPSRPRRVWPSSATWAFAPSTSTLTTPRPGQLIRIDPTGASRVVQDPMLGPNGMVLSCDGSRRGTGRGATGVPVDVRHRFGVMCDTRWADGLCFPVEGLDSAGGENSSWG